MCENEKKKSTNATCSFIATHTHKRTHMDVPLSNADLSKRLEHVTGFVGVYSYDLLPVLQDGDFCVVNTDNVIPLYDAPEGGHHWLTVCREKKRILIFDSFGRNLQQMELDYTEPRLTEYFMNAYGGGHCELYTNTQVLQHTSTAVCGHYAILMGRLFSEHGLRGALETLRDEFTENTLSNDRKVIMTGAGQGGDDDDDDDDDDNGDWDERLADELHKPRRTHFPRRRVTVHAVDDIWSADLVDMQSFARYNKGIRFLLTVIDLFSRYTWIVPLKDKTGAEVRDAFQHILRTSGRKPGKLWVDEGKEFYNSTLKKWLANHHIDMYSTHNEGKAVVVERFNRTMKSRMWRYFTLKSTNVYRTVLPKLVDDYNNTKHRSIGMSPVEASKKENERFVLNASGRPSTRPGRRFGSPKFHVGDRVRLAVRKSHFEKGYTPNWTEEVFVIDRILPTSPVTYHVHDLMDESIDGSFYEQELQKAVQTKFRIEKVLRKRRGRALIKWKGYSDKFNSWHAIDELEKI